MGQHPENENIVWHQTSVNRSAREELNGHGSCVLWFTGLSGSGKSTLAHRIEELLYRRGCRTFVLDGDNVRHGLSSDLDFSPNDRRENIRRIGEAAKLMMESGLIVMTAFISPFRADRTSVREQFQQGDFFEIHCSANLSTCESRDTKGLYQKARSGQLKNYTGIDSPYEVPMHPELTIDTAGTPLDECAGQVLSLMEKQGILKKLDTTKN